LTLRAHLLQFDGSDAYAGSTFSLGKTASCNNSGQCLTVRSASGCNPWQPQSRPTFSPAVHMPQYNGFRGTVAAPRFASRKTPFSYDDSPPSMKSHSRPPRVPVVSGKVKSSALFGLFYMC